MTLNDIETCIQLVERYRVPEFSLSEGGATLALRAATSVPSAAAPTPCAVATVRAAAAGVFRLAHPATSERAVAEGQAVWPGTVVGFLQVGPCLRPVTVAAAGVLGAPLVADGTVVGFGAAVFKLRTGA